MLKDLLVQILLLFCLDFIQVIIVIHRCIFRLFCFLDLFIYLLGNFICFLLDICRHHFIEDILFPIPVDSSIAVSVRIVYHVIRYVAYVLLRILWLRLHFIHVVENLKLIVQYKSTGVKMQGPSV